MAETAAAALLAAGPPTAAAQAAAAFLSTYAVAINTAAALVYSNEQRRSAKRKARRLADRNAQDQHVNLRAAVAPRREVLGRAVTGGDLVWPASTGKSKTKLVMVVALSAREIDGVEQVFVGGEPVTLDANGYVTTPPYRSTNVTSTQQFLAYSGAGTYTLDHPPLPGSVVVMWPGTTYDSDSGSSDAINIPVLGVTSNQVTLGSASFSGTATVTYQRYTTDEALRILIHRGEPGQVVDPVVNALFPTQWDAAHRLDGIAYAVIIANYSPPAFFQGLKNVSFLVRGSKIHDPRTGTAAWTDNPALLARHVCLNPLDSAMPSVPVNDALCIAAANVCDQVVSETVGGVGGTRKRYVAGTVASDGEPPKDVLDDLCQAMAGGWVWSSGAVCLRAGAYVAPVLTLNDAAFGPGEVTVQARTPREQLVNVGNAKAFDPANRWQYVDVPEVRSSTYITDDGATLPMDVEMPAVHSVAQAQQILAIMLREARLGWVITANFKMVAYPVEVFDHIYLQVTRYRGAALIPCIVIARTWSMTGGVTLTLRETGPAVYADGTAFDAPLVPPANLRPVPWDVDPPANVVLTSAVATVGDATQTARLRVSWDAITDQSVLDGGAVEIQYRPADEPEPAGDWPGITTSGRATSEIIRGLQRRRYYLVRLRCWNRLVSSQWSVQKLHKVEDVPAIEWASIAGSAAIEASIAAAADAAADAQTAADNAATSASAANIAIADSASDAKLSPVEKQRDKILWDALVAEKAGIDAQADAYGITTEKATYGIAYSTLASYITPLLADLTTTSDIVGADYRANFNALLVAKQALLNKIAAEAGTRAQWGLVIGPGKPADGATVNRFYSGSTDPSISETLVDGDVWRDTSTTPVVLRTRIGGAWVAASNLSTGVLAQLDQVSTAQIVVDAATDVIERLRATSGGSYGFGTHVVAGVQVTPAVNCKAVVQVNVDASGTVAFDSGKYLAIFADEMANVTVGTDPDYMDAAINLATLEASDGILVNSARTKVSATWTFSLTGGVSYLLGLVHRNGVPATTGLTIYGKPLTQVQLIKR